MFTLPPDLSSTTCHSSKAAGWCSTRPSLSTPAAKSVRPIEEVAKKKKKRTQDDGPPPAAGDLPARCWRVAGPYRGMCGDVHMMHRSFFDAIDMFPVALSSVKGRIAVQPNCDDSCCAVLHLHGGGGGATLSHRIARFCVHLSRTKQGPGEVSGRRGENERLFRLEAGPEFLISCYDQPFHCKLRKCSGPSRAATLTPKASASLMMSDRSK